MRALALAGAVVAACAPDPGDPSRPRPPDDPDLDALLQAAVDAAFTVDGRELEASYTDAMGDADASCPYAYQGFWYDSCETKSGASFDGYVYEYADPDGSDGYGIYWALYAEATLGRAEGPPVVASGYAGWGDVDDGQARTVYHYAYGTFEDPASEGWLAEGASVGMYVEASTLADGGRSVYVDGQHGGLGGDPGQAVDWDEVYLLDADWPDGTCPGAPIGTAWLRTADGRWLELAFETCDGCAGVRDGGEELGVACADFSRWLDWEVSPW